MSPYLTIERIGNGTVRPASALKIPLSPVSSRGIVGVVPDISDTLMVIENGKYAIRLVCQHGTFGNPKLFVLDSEAGVSAAPRTETIDGKTQDVFSFSSPRHSERGLQPFLLHHDLVDLAIEDLRPNDPDHTTWRSGLFPCLCESESFSRNVETILKTLIDPDLEESVITRWMLHDEVNTKDLQGGIIRGALRNDRPKNLNGFIRLARDVLDCYKRQYPFFRTRAQHKIATKPVLVPYEKVRVVSSSDFLWLMHNGEHLPEVSFETGLKYGDRNFMPDKMRAKRYVKNYDFEENRIVVSFLASAILKTETIHNRLKAAIQTSANIGAGEITEGGIRYLSPLGTVRKWQLSYFMDRLDVLHEILVDMKKFLRHYRAILQVSAIPIPTIPRMTKIFQEITGYRDVYERIRRWFGFGEFAMENEEFLLGVKKLDKLLEYYGLFTILQVLNRNGFTPDKSGNDIYSFSYTLNRSRGSSVGENEREVHNTYRLRREDVEITVFCQCAIYSHWSSEKEWEQKANGIRLSSFQMLNSSNSRSGYSSSYWQPNGNVDNKSSELYVTPDFLLKIHRTGIPDTYIIMDAKFSRRSTIFQYEATEIFSKYFLNVIPIDPGVRIGGVWILQGRTNEDEKSIRVTAPPFMNAVDFRIIPLDTTARTGDEIWAGIRQFLE